MAVLLPDTALDPPMRHLIDAYQRDFPLFPTPFAVIAAAVGLTESDVLGRLAALSEQGAVSRVGAVVRPHAAGASTLAAVAAPPAEIAAVAAHINRFAGVNHNYEREHTFNLWFVITGRTRADLSATIAGIGAETGLTVLDLPLERSYHIDLGFPLTGDGERPKPSPRPLTCTPDDTDRRLLGAIETGLPLVSRPFEAVGRQLDLPEATVIARLHAMVSGGVISRFGIVVRHRAFGFVANGMVVWDIADEDVDAVAGAFAAEPGVTLCYRRPRRPPVWRYNLFTMVHGRDRAAAGTVIARLAALAGPVCRDHAVLFSLRCFKQRGAVFSDAVFSGTREAAE